MAVLEIELCVCCNAARNFCQIFGDCAVTADLSWQSTLESNPLPIKAALAMMGRMGNHLRLPLVPMHTKFDALLRTSLVEAGVLPA